MTQTQPTTLSYAVGEARVCWDHSWLDRHHQCDADFADGDLLIQWGRCRSGRRWFWIAVNVGDDKDVHGWTDNKVEATVAARAAVVALADGARAVADLRHGVATYRLRKLNTERRRARPSNGGTDTTVREYLYARGVDSDGDHRTIAFPITKRTAKRVYYQRTPWRQHVDDQEIGYVDRDELEANGEVRRRSAGWWEPDSRLYIKPPPLDTSPDRIEEVGRLKADMAAAHPDRGGTNQEFIAARQRYEHARQVAS